VTIRGYREFEFDLPGALLQHLVRTLDGIEEAPLITATLDEIPNAQGLYQLFLDGNLVYVGKTDAEAGLFRRLARHANKILHRRTLDPMRVSFKAVRIFVFTAMDLETQLIAIYTGQNGTPWNGSGFGSNDPGRNRDRSTPGRFDQQFPVDIDRQLPVDFGGTSSAAETAQGLKNALPYTFRFQTLTARSRIPHPELTATQIKMPQGPTTARKVIVTLVSQLPPGWQATALSAVLILYKEQDDNYPQATVLARS